MSEEVIVRFRFTADELVEAHRRYARLQVRPFFRWLVWLFVGLLFLGTVWAARAHIWVAALSMYGVLVCLFLFGRWSRWLARRRFRQYPEKDGEIEWRISNENIHINGPFTTATSEWKAFHKIVETPDGFLFFRSSRLFHWVPRHGFACDEDYQRVSALARTHARSYSQST